MTHLNTCKECNERRPGCHDSCDIYKAFKAEIDKVRINRQKANEVYYMDKAARARCYKISKKKGKI